MDKYEFRSSIDLTSPLMEPTKGVAYTCSIYLTILLTIERYIAICHQRKLAHMISRRKTTMYIGWVILFSVLWNLPKCFIYKFENGQVLKNDIARSNIFKNIYIAWGHGIVQFFIPLTLLIVLNLFLLIKVRKFGFCWRFFFSGFFYVVTSLNMIKLQA